MIGLPEFFALEGTTTVVENDDWNSWYDIAVGKHLLTYPGSTYIECDPLGVYVLPLGKETFVDVDRRPLVARLYFFAREEGLLGE